MSDEYDATRLLIGHMVQRYESGVQDEFSVHSLAGAAALERLRHYEMDGWPAPKVMADTDCSVTLVWRPGHWTIQQTFEAGDEPYWFVSHYAHPVPA
jgi:hypothetical protein